MCFFALECMNCLESYSFHRMFEGCPNCKTEDFTANLVVKYDFEQIKRRINRKTLKDRCKAGLSKYVELLPVRNVSSLATLGEGNTPLIRCTKLGQELGIENLYIKDESRNPTGSFKDRLACVGTTVALQFGSKSIVAGGGNMASAASAYGSKYGLHVISFETLSESRIAILQTMLYGGYVVVLEKYDQRYALMKICVEKHGSHPVSSYTPSPSGDPYSQEGSKTIAYEICEDLGWRSPDRVIVPTGQGFCLHGIWNGFKDFYGIGLIDSLPSMIASESSSGGSFTKTKDIQHIRAVDPKMGIARHAVAPKGSYKGYKAIVDSNGSSVMVTDEEVLEAVYALARSEGVFASTTSATAVAALKQYVKEAKIDKDETVVCVITAGGFKDTDLLGTTNLQIPNAIRADWKTLVSFLKQKYNFTF